MLLLFFFVISLVVSSDDFTCCVTKNMAHSEYHGIQCTNCLCVTPNGWKASYSFKTFDCYWCGNYSSDYEPPQEGMHFSSQPSYENQDEVATDEIKFLELLSEEEIREKDNEACGPYMCCYYTDPHHDYLEPTICYNVKNTYWDQCPDHFDGLPYCGMWQVGTLEDECFFMYKQVNDDGSVSTFRSKNVWDQRE